MSEKENHKNFKLLARSILLKKGFKADEIQEEFSISFKKPNGKRKTYRIDMVGINDSKTVAIECGNTKLSKLKELKIIFDEVVYIPYEFTLDIEKSQLANSLVEQLSKYQNLYEKSLEKIERMQTVLDRDSKTTGVQNWRLHFYKILNEVAYQIEHNNLRSMNIFSSYEHTKPDVKFIINYFWEKYQKDIEKLGYV